MNPDFLFNLHTPGDIIYDIETYPNVFTFRCVHDETDQRWNFEISFRRNDTWMLCKFIERCRDLDCRWVGFNNIGFDYPVVHFIYNYQIGITVIDIYNKAMEIIRSPNKFAHIIWDSDHLVKQVDLFKIHHFDNKAKATSLKILEFNMKMNSVEDLPFDVGTELNHEQADTLCQYNDHDVNATRLFYHRTKGALGLRETLSQQFNMNLINSNDVKIGERILVHEMKKKGVDCYHYFNGKRERKQTIRDQIDLSEVVFPYVEFENPEFNKIKKFLSEKVIYETNGIFKDLIASVDGCQYKFGTGGLHMSIDSQVIKSCDEYQIIDIDVASYYPNLAIKNRVYPAHLGEAFCDVLEDIFHVRKQYKKSDPRNGAFKLALNGVYGLSNNEYSPFFDSMYTMKITINGQLLLCMLIEQLLKAPNVNMIQANTDGVTFLCPRDCIEWAREVCRWWETVTKLTLEETFYSRMMVRDVNNYIAEVEDGTLKRIGAYAYETAEENPATRELPHHKDWSARVVQMAAEGYLAKGLPVNDFILGHTEPYDFLLRTKVPRSSSLQWGGDTVSNVVRYYISTDGQQLEKVMPPAGPEGAYKRKNSISDELYHTVLSEVGDAWDERIHTKNQSKYAERRTGIHTGWNVQMCDKLDECDFSDINYDWYIKEAEKLTLLKGA